MIHHPSPHNGRTLCGRFRAEEVATTLNPDATTCPKCADLFFGMMLADNSHMVPDRVLDGTLTAVLGGLAKPVLDAAVLGLFGLCVAYLVANWPDVHNAIATAIGSY